MRKAKRDQYGPTHNQGAIAKPGGYTVPPRAPRTRGRAIDQRCGACGAQPKDPCISLGMRDVPKGTPMVGFHPPRQRLAVRADNARREAEGTLHIRPGSTPEKGVLEVDDGGLCPGCSRRIKLTAKGLIHAHNLDGGKRSRYQMLCTGSGERPTDG